MKNIAIIGRSGSGKSTFAKYMIDNHHYKYCSTGNVCRSICNILYGSEDRHYLNLITDILKASDKDILTKAAIRDNANNNLIFDSVRFISDYNFLKDKGFIFIKIECDESVAISRLQDRNQKFDIKKDLKHSSETEQKSIPYDFVLENNGSKNQFVDNIIDLVARIS
jgi:dephospho-CoA kinase